MSLWVLLVVPVSAFAAVVAMAGPQRLAAEASMREAADDLAELAVAWRDGQQERLGPLWAFPPACARSQEQQAQLDELLAEIEELEASDPMDPQLDDLRRMRDDRLSEFAPWEASCRLLSDSVARDLGYLGVDVGSLRGFYSGSLAEAILDSPGQAVLPCKVSEIVVVRDAVHVALTGYWQDRGWAAAQVWPDGARLSVESIGRLSAAGTGSSTHASCGAALDTVNDEGQPVWLADPEALSRRLSQSVARQTFFG